MNLIRKNTFLILACVSLFAGCHTMVPTTHIHDNDMTCSEIAMEIAKTEALQKEIAGNCGISGRNALGLFFWPSIVVNEVTGHSAQNAATQRIDHLNKLYIQKSDQREKN